MRMPAALKKPFLNISIVCTVALLAACVNPSDAVDSIDAVTASPDKFTILLENEHVRVIEYVLKPGESDEWHTHPPKSSYIVSGGRLKIHLDGGETLDVDEKRGTAAWMDALGKHYAENVGETEVKIVLTEVKNAR